MNAYSNEKLLGFIASDGIWIKPYMHYEKVLRKSIQRKGWDYDQLNARDQANDILPDEAYFDLMEIVKELAQIILDERKKQVDIKRDLKDLIDNLA